MLTQWHEEQQWHVVAGKDRTLGEHQVALDLTRPIIGWPSRDLSGVDLTPRGMVRLHIQSSA
jgi:hypothetical protein